MHTKTHPLIRCEHIKTSLRPLFTPKRVVWSVERKKNVTPSGMHTKTRLPVQVMDITLPSGMSLTVTSPEITNDDANRRDITADDVNFREITIFGANRHAVAALGAKHRAISAVGANRRAVTTCPSGKGYRLGWVHLPRRMPLRKIMRAVRHVQDLGRRAVGRDARAGFCVRRGRDHDRGSDGLLLLLVVPARMDHRGVSGGRAPPLFSRCRMFLVLQVGTFTCPMTIPFSLFLPRSFCTGGADVIRKEAWPFYRTNSGVRLWWELKEPKGHKGPKGFQCVGCRGVSVLGFKG
ncbi:hypothetical protein T484DRAFT_2800105 [Baffinella frigidus]|nr:hypothetical protein T484DRAFT_2800105 [Cryptophyta sp. CCMP2293]